MKRKQLLILVLLLVGVATIFAASLGDYRTAGSGTWSTLGNWRVCTTAPNTWSAATSLPTSTTPVYIQGTHLITLTADATCGNLNIAGSTTGVPTSATTSYGRVLLGSYSLNLYGSLKTYWAVVNTVPGTDISVIPNMLLTSSSTSGKLVVKGSTRTLTAAASWQADAPVTFPSTTFYTGSSSNFHLVINADSGATITIPTGMRPQSWDIISGITDLGTVAKEVDNGTNGTGDVTIRSGATVKCNMAAVAVFRRINAQKAGSFTLESGALIQASGSSNLNMNEFNFYGTVEYNGAAQTLFHQFVTDSALPSIYNNVILSGSGAKTLDYNSTINGTLTRSGTASLALSTYSLTYGASSTLLYQGSGAQNTANTEWPASGSMPHNVIINNAAGVTLNGAKTLAGDLTLTNGVLAKGANSLSVNGTTFVLGGSETGTSGYTDGYNDVANYININPNDVNMVSFTVSMTTPSLYPLKVDREWAINGTYTGSKDLTLYWTSADDHAFNWIGLGILPSVYKGLTEYTQTAYNVSSDPRWITVSIPSSLTKGTYTIGAANDTTLPIELSSFTAVLTSDFLIKLEWITQSETGVSGFNVYRGLENMLSEASLVSGLIEASNTAEQHHYEYYDTDVYEPGTYYYWLGVQDYDGSVDYHGPTTVYYDTTTHPGTPDIPLEYGLISIFPNPFNPSATIAYNLSQDADLSFVIYNSRGQVMRRVSQGHKSAGIGRLVWDGLDTNGKACSTGVYHIRMKAGNDYYTKKAMLLK